MNLFEMFKATIVGTEVSVSICIHLYVMYLLFADMM